MANEDSDHSDVSPPTTRRSSRNVTPTSYQQNQPPSNQEPNDSDVPLRRTSRIITPRRAPGMVQPSSDSRRSVATSKPASQHNKRKNTVITDSETDNHSTSQNAHQNKKQRKKRTTKPVADCEVGTEV